MGLLIKELQVAGDKGEKKEEVLFDNSASCSVIKRDIAEELSTIIKMRSERKFKLGDGESIVKTNEVANIEIEIDGKTIDDKFYVIDKLGKGIIVGADTMQKWDMVLEPKEEKIIVRKDPQALEFFKVSCKKN